MDRSAFGFPVAWFGLLAAMMAAGPMAGILFRQHRRPNRSDGVLVVPVADAIDGTLGDVPVDVSGESPCGRHDAGTAVGRFKISVNFSDGPKKSKHGATVNAGEIR